ncbi:hypothetical protein BJ741DRAFT_9676 [Chytriomyces cf. hyalinus JEL632]|nr:hypothetical protein BJ741DRAFT_9676 [Chytriomyces cf. hyalinus JEL632]
MRHHHTKTDAELKAAISRIPDRCLKAVMTASKKRKQTSDDDTADKWAKYKKFLVTYAPETLRNNPSTLEPVTGVSHNEEDMAEAITKLIKANLAILASNEAKSNQVRLIVAEQMLRLNELFNNGSKGDFYEFISVNLGISKRLFCYYSAYYKFATKYSRFQQISASFFAFRDMIRGLDEWFDSRECSRLSENTILVVSKNSSCAHSCTKWTQSWHTRFVN